MVFFIILQCYSKLVCVTDAILRVNFSHNVLIKEAVTEVLTQMML